MMDRMFVITEQQKTVKQNRRRRCRLRPMFSSAFHRQYLLCLPFFHDRKVIRRHDGGWREAIRVES